MPVSTFNQPDFTSQTPSAYKTAIDDAVRVIARMGASFAPHEQAVPAMTVRIDAGIIYSSSTKTVAEVAAQNSAVITAPSSNPRIDRVVVDRTAGTVSVITGSEAASPSAPAIAGDVVPIAQIALTVGMTEIANTDITDERNVFALGMTELAVTAVGTLTQLTAPAVGDQLALADVSASDLEKRITLEDMLKVIDALTEDTAPDTSADYVVTYDTSDSGAKKVALNVLGGDTGEVKMFAGAAASIPSGWLACDGSAVSRTTYADLFSTLGTLWGVGDGSTTFNLPDFRGKGPVGVNDAGLPNGETGSYSTRNEADVGGAETHALTTAELAAHTHGAGSYAIPKAGGAGSAATVSTSTSAFINFSVTGTSGSAGSGTAHNNMQPFTAINFIIKT